MLQLNNRFLKKNCINSTKVFRVTMLITIKLSSFMNINKNVIEI